MDLWLSKVGYSVTSMFPLSVARIPPFKYFPTAEYKDALQKLELHGCFWAKGATTAARETPGSGNSG